MRSAGALAFHVAYTLSSEETKWDKSDLEIRTETGHRARLSEDFVKKGLKLKIPEIVMGWIQDSANSDVVAAMLDVDSIRGDFESVQLPEWELEFSKWGAMSYQLSDAQHELLTQCMMRLNVNATGVCFSCLFVVWMLLNFINMMIYSLELSRTRWKFGIQMLSYRILIIWGLILQKRRRLHSWFVYI